MKNKILPLTIAAALVLGISILGASHVFAGHHGHGKNKMEMMDTNGDGSISKDEFMSHKEQHFMKKDENGDGVLTEDEINKHCKYKDQKKLEKE